MLSGVVFDGVSEDSEAVFCGRLFCFFDVVFECGDNNGSEYAENGYDYYQFYK